MKIRGRRIVTSAVTSALVAGLLLAGCGGKHSSARGAGGADQTSCTASSGRITIATANVGTPFYGLGSGLAQLISSKTALKATAAETAGSEQNLQLLGTGTYDMGFSLGDTAADAVTGHGIFTGKPEPVVALAKLYTAYVQVLVRTDARISSIADLRGKRVSTGTPKSGSEVTARRLLSAAGLDPAKDVHTVRLDLSKAADGMKKGAIDAIIWTAGLPIAQITDLTTSLDGQVSFLDITGQLPAMKKINPAYEADVIPAAAYHQRAGTPTIVLPNLLLVRTDFPIGDACAITKLIFENKSTLEKIHPVAKNIALDQARDLGPVPLHPGADRALRMLSQSSVSAPASPAPR